MDWSAIIGKGEAQKLKLTVFMPALAGRFLIFWFLPLDEEMYAGSCRWTLQIFFPGGIVIKSR